MVVAMRSSLQSCPHRHRLGAGRAVVFGVTTVAAPMLVHDTTLAHMAGMWLVLASLFAGMSWLLRCRPLRRSTVVALMIAGQLLVHATGTYVQGGGVSEHAHMDHATMHAPHGMAPDSSQSLATSATDGLLMVLAHVSAILIGLAVLTVLERRALAAIERCVGRVHQSLVQWMDRRRAAGWSIRVATKLIPQFGAEDARIRSARACNRSQSRRGPPARAWHAA